MPKGRPPFSVRPARGHAQLRNCTNYWHHGQGRTFYDSIGGNHGRVQQDGSDFNGWNRFARDTIGRQVGPCCDWSADGTGNYISLAKQISFASGAESTFIFQFQYDNTTNNVGFFGHSASGNFADNFRRSGTGVTTLNDTAGSSEGIDAGIDIVTGTVMQLALVVKGNDPAAYSNGRLGEQETGGNIGAFKLDEFGRRGTSTGGVINFAWIRIYNRALSSREIFQIWLDPYAPFARPLPVWIPAAAAGGTDVDGTLATLSVTPLAASINDKTEVAGTLATLPINALTASINDKTEIAGTLESLPISALTAGINDKTQVAGTLENLPITTFQASVAVAGDQDITGTLENLPISALTASVNDKTQIAATLDTLPINTLQASIAIGKNITGTLETLPISTLAASINDKTQIAGTLANLPIAPLQATVTVTGTQAIIGTLANLDLQVFVAGVNDKTEISGTLDTLPITTFAASINDKTEITGTLETLSLTALLASVSAGITYAAPDSRTFVTKAQPTFVTKT